jgi:ankyrin repeat protein
LKGYLLTQKANPNLVTDDKETLLTIAVEKERVDWVQRLCQLGCSCNVDIPKSPLQRAIDKRSLALIEVLLQYGAELDKLLPLHQALQRNDLKLFAFLLDRNANPDLMTDDGRPLLCKLLGERKLSFITELLKHKVDCNLTSKTGELPLFMALQDIVVLQLLLSSHNKVNLDCLTSSKKTALYLYVI